MAIGDIYRVTAWCYFQEQAGLNVLHYQVTGEQGGTLTPALVATQFGSQNGPLYRQVLASTASYIGCTSQRIVPKPPSLLATSTTSAGAGLVAGDVLPKQTAGIISFYTLNAGRRYRGRAYVPFPGEADNVADSTPSPTYVTMIGQLGLSLKGMNVTSGGLTATLALVIYHRDLLIGTLVQGHVTKKLWATQRRRGDFGRTNADTPF